MSDSSNPFSPNNSDDAMDGPATDDLDGTDRDVADESTPEGDDDDKDADLNT